MSKLDSERDALRQAIELAGGVYELAPVLGVSPQAIYKWLKKRLPAGRVLDVEFACGARVSRYQLRGDLYPAQAPVPIEPDGSLLGRQIALAASD